MNPYPSRFGATLTINMKILYACALGWASWLMWPDAPEWRGLGLLSILIALASVFLLLDAVKLMVQLYWREKAVGEYLAQGRAPKSSKMASDAQLEQGGMR